MDLTSAPVSGLKQPWVIRMQHGANFKPGALRGGVALFALSN